VSARSGSAEVPIPDACIRQSERVTDGAADPTTLFTNLGFDLRIEERTSSLLQSPPGLWLCNGSL